MTESIPSNLVAQTWSKPFEPPKSIPASADVVIIGGGIIGVSTAWFLAKQGIKVVVCEKGHVAGEQSSRNWGWIRNQGRDEREIPMMKESLKIWQTLSDDIGEDVGYEQTGCIYAARTDAQLAGYLGWLPTAKKYGLDTRAVSSEELAQHIRGSSITWKGGIITPSDGRAEPHKATPAIARAAIREGATILESCAVRGLETEAGHVSAVVTEHGTIKAPKVLCAGGAWTSMFCRSLGIDLPQLRVHATVIRTEPGEDVMDGALWEDQTGIRRRQDDGYTVSSDNHLYHSITPSSFKHFIKFLPAFVQEAEAIKLRIGRDFLNGLRAPKRWRLDVESPFEKTRVLNPEPNSTALKGIRKGIDTVFPALANREIAESWGGMMDVTPDAIPVIDEAKNIPGFHIATGFSGHGFGIGPGAGKVLAGLLGGEDTGIDVSEFRLSRFSDGSKMVLYKRV